ncbi:MAG: RNA polymerase Rpb4 [Candidatus Bathyarchaeota archaeon]|nr:RNA polymerase Rpb4 [Candidatus Bathyarchaeota archaeon]
MTSPDLGDEKRLTLPQVKALLEEIGEENLDQFQRRTLDYVSKFTKVEPDVAASLLQTLTGEYELDESEAVQILNCMPETVDELRVFLAGGRKIIETQKLAAIVELLNEKRILK